jgi:hypothetical protein
LVIALHDTLLSFVLLFFRDDRDTTSSRERDERLRDDRVRDDRIRDDRVRDDRVRDDRVRDDRARDDRDRPRDDRFHNDRSRDDRYLEDRPPSHSKDADLDRVSSRPHDYDPERDRGSSFLDSRRSAFEERGHSVCDASKFYLDELVLSLIRILQNS